MTANLVIFLGILYTMLHFIGCMGLLHGYHLSGLVVALGILGLGYGIRYGSSICLYAAIGVCAGLSLYFGMLVVSAWTTYSMLRLVLGTWTLLAPLSCHSADADTATATGFPLPMSRYGEAVLRRFQKRAGPKERREGDLGDALVARIHQPIVPGCGASKQAILTLSLMC